MNTNKRALAGAALLALAGAAAAQTNEPGVWMEAPGDAGGTLAEAQRVHGAGAGVLVSIVGELGPEDVDVYRIHVCDPAAFGASTVGGTPVDTVLYLFDALGNGIAMSDDAGGAQSTLTSAFMAGLAPGDYYLAVAGKGALPVDLAGDALFEAEPAGVERGPDGPGAANGVWVFSPGAPAVGPYQITLDGSSLEACRVTDTRSFGLQMSALRGSTLSRGPDSVVTISSPTGTGGVELHYGAVRGGTPDFFVDPAAMAPDATMIDTQFGTINGMPGMVLGSLSSSVVGSGLVGGADFSPIGAGTYTVSAMLDGEIVDVASNLSGPTVEYGATARCKKKTSIDDCPHWRTMANRIDFEEPIMVSLAGRAPVMADALCVCPEAGAGVDVGEVSSETILVTGIGEFTLVGGGVSQFGLELAGLGEVLVTGLAGSVAVTNIGSSGLDGIDVKHEPVKLKPLKRFKIALDIADATTMPAGAFLRAKGVDVRGGHFGTVVLRGTGPAGGGDILIEADLTDIGSSTQRIVVLSGGTVVAEFPGHSGPVGSARGWPTWLGKQGGRAECFVAAWPAPTTFVIDGAIYMGDEMRILAEVVVPVDEKGGMEITAAGIGSLAITGVDLTQECRVDFDGDGRLNIFDFLAFFNAFGSGDLAADFDGDGALTFFDFLAFQNEFDAGCA